jgi:hypothetical protein
LKKKFLTRFFLKRCFGKETARRWAQNGEIRVTASDWDRQLAAAGKDFVKFREIRLFGKTHGTLPELL